MVQEGQKQGFPSNHKLLSQLTIWIGDTAVTMDMTPHVKRNGGSKEVSGDNEHCNGQQTS